MGIAQTGFNYMYLEAYVKVVLLFFSVYLFLLCAEIMACMFRENNDMEWLKVDNNEHKLKQFADDSTCTLKMKCLFTILYWQLMYFHIYRDLNLTLKSSYYSIWDLEEIEMQR